MDLSGLQTQLSGLKHYPIEQWHPPFCGAIPLHIDRDGQWLYQQSAINRIELVRLFAAILSCQQGRYLLTTPAEQVEITVADAPFMLVACQWLTPTNGTAQLQVTSSVGESYLISAEFPVQLHLDPATGDTLPYLQLPRGLHAKFSRSLYYELVEVALSQPQPDATNLSLTSGEYRFSLGAIDGE
jgi:hypothetical protein